MSVLIGPRLRYFVEDRHGRKLGCLQFSQAVVSLPCRDAWVGWPEDGWKAHLERVVGNTRFLLFPWVGGPEPGFQGAVDGGAAAG